MGRRGWGCEHRASHPLPRQPLLCGPRGHLHQGPVLTCYWCPPQRPGKSRIKSVGACGWGNTVHFIRLFRMCVCGGVQMGKRWYVTIFLFFIHLAINNVLSCVQLFVTSWTVAHQASLSLRSSRQEYWSGLPFSSPWDLPDPGIESISPEFLAVQADSLPRSHWRSQQSTSNFFFWSPFPPTSTSNFKRFST